MVVDTACSVVDEEDLCAEVGEVVSDVIACTIGEAKELLAVDACVPAVDGV